LSPARGLSVRRGARSAVDAAVGEPCAGHDRCGTISDRESPPVCLVDSRRSAPRAAKPGNNIRLRHARSGTGASWYHNELKIALNHGLLAVRRRRTGSAGSSAAEAGYDRDSSVYA
jgi:hypothetical protein